MTWTIDLVGWNLDTIAQFRILPWDTVCNAEYRYQSTKQDALKWRSVNKNKGYPDGHVVNEYIWDSPPSTAQVF